MVGRSPLFVMKMSKQLWRHCCHIKPTGPIKPENRAEFQAVRVAFDIFNSFFFVWKWDVFITARLVRFGLDCDVTLGFYIQLHLYSNNGHCWQRVRIDMEQFGSRFIDNEYFWFVIFLFVLFCFVLKTGLWELRPLRWDYDVIGGFLLTIKSLLNTRTLLRNDQRIQLANQKRFDR